MLLKWIVFQSTMILNNLISQWKQLWKRWSTIANCTPTMLSLSQMNLMPVFRWVTWKSGRKRCRLEMIVLVRFLDQFFGWLTIDDFPDSRPAAAPAEDAQPAWGGGGRLQTRLNNVDNVDYETSATCFYNNVDYDDIIYHIDNVNACSQNYNDHRNIKGNTLQRRQRQPSF